MLHIPHSSHTAATFTPHPFNRPQPANLDTQQQIRNLLFLASSFLVLASTIDPIYGLHHWSITLDQLADHIVLLHKRGQLEIETLNAASQACSQCWSVSTSWSDLNEAKAMIRRVARKMDAILDENKKEYKGVRIYGS